MQIDVDIGSSTVANGVLGLVFGVITTLVVDMAFLVQVIHIILSWTLQRTNLLHIEKVNEWYSLSFSSESRMNGYLFESGFHE